VRDITFLHPVLFSAYPDDLTSRSQVLTPAFFILVLVVNKFFYFVKRFIEFPAGNINTMLFLNVTPRSLMVTSESTWRHVPEESISFVKILNYKCVHPYYMIIDNSNKLTN
jgi:hypothetical protein